MDGSIIQRIKLTKHPLPMWLVGGGRYRAHYFPKLDRAWIPFMGVRVSIPGVPLAFDLEEYMGPDGAVSWWWRRSHPDTYILHRCICEEHDE